MTDYDSDSSADGEDVESNVLLGYASNDPTGDDFSQLGGRPSWLDGKTNPPGAFAKCKVCNGVMSLLLQLNGDLTDWFPHHERRLYVLACKRKLCRRKAGSIAALRAVRVTRSVDKIPVEPVKKEPEAVPPEKQNMGEMLFGAKPSVTSANANPFTSGSANATPINPFSSTKGAATSPTASTEPSPNVSLPGTFAQKAKVTESPAQSPSSTDSPLEPWPSDPNPYPSYYLDADKEYLDPEPEAIATQARLDTEGVSGDTLDEKALFESSMDKTFQQFADKLNQNPEQVLRYEFAGHALLYSNSDAVAKLFSPTSDTKVQTTSSNKGNGQPSTSKLPRCASCGAARVFEMQLTPHAITELEADEISIDGMDWGTIIVGVCSEDCTRKGAVESEVNYLEEWVGVQWEETGSIK